MQKQKDFLFNDYLEIRKFRESKTFSQRCILSSEILSKYPNCVPVIVEKSSGETKLKHIDKKQYLVPQEMNFSTFFFTIRKRLGVGIESKSSSNVGIWIYAGKTPITNPSLKMSEVYNYYKDNDGFLYLQYKSENVFG
jgi:GABA(A) receptor-associated protein